MCLQQIQTLVQEAQLLGPCNRQTRSITGALHGGEKKNAV